MQSKYMVLLQEAQNPRIGEKTIDNLMSGGFTVRVRVTLFHSAYIYLPLMYQWNVEKAFDLRPT